MAEQYARRGFTLLEALITIAIMAITVSGAVAIYGNITRETDLDTVSMTIIYNLKNAQARAMSGESGLKWGVHFVHSASDYYEVFSTPTDYSDASMATSTVNYLPASIYFSVPSASSSVVFAKTTGVPSASSSVTINNYLGSSRAITINSSGGIY